MLTRHWRQDGRSYDNTTAAHQSQDEHMTTEKQMEGKKKIYYYHISQMRGKQKGPQNRHILGKRYNCPTPKHSYLATLETGKPAVFNDTAENFLQQFKSRYPEIHLWTLRPKGTQKC